MHDRFVLLKRERDLNDRERLLLDGWTANYPDLGVAYRPKEAFYGIYEKARSPQEAMKAYEAWNRAVVPQVRDAYADLIRAWSNWQPWIINNFEHPVTNAYTESLNSLIRVMNRFGRGYSFEALRAKILFTEGADKLTRVRPKLERRREPADMGYGVPKNGVGFYSPLGHMGKMIGLSHQHEAQGAEVNYGAHIPTLIALIEAGKI